VADNYSSYAELDGVTDKKVKEEIVKRTSRKLQITDTARNID